jgi:hypothetical protein
MPKVVIDIYLIVENCPAGIGNVYKVVYNLVLQFTVIEFMPTISIKLKNNSESVYFQSILGTYSHIAWARTDDPASGIIQVIPTEDLLEEARNILERLKKEIEFEEVGPGGERL